MEAPNSPAPADSPALRRRFNWRKLVITIGIIAGVLRLLLALLSMGGPVAPADISGWYLYSDESGAITLSLHDASGKITGSAELTAIDDGKLDDSKLIVTGRRTGSKLDLTGSLALAGYDSPVAIFHWIGSIDNGAITLNDGQDNYVFQPSTQAAAQKAVSSVAANFKSRQAAAGQ